MEPTAMTIVSDPISGNTDGDSPTTHIMTSETKTITSHWVMTSTEEVLTKVINNTAESSVAITYTVPYRTTIGLDNTTDLVNTTKPGESIILSTHAPIDPASRLPTLSDVTQTVTSNPVTTSTFQVTESISSNFPTNFEVSDPTSSSESSGLATGAVVGIAVGACCVVIIITVVLCIVCRYKKKHKGKRYRSDDNLNDYKLDLHTVTSDQGRPEPLSTNNSKPGTVYFDKNLTGTPNKAIVGEESSAVDVNGQSESHQSEQPGESGVSMRENRPNPHDRAILAESRFSLGPLMLGEDLPVSSTDTYTTMYSTNTFK